jgi:type IV secretion system protein VirB4
MRYPGAQAFVFDRGNSMLPLAKAMEVDGVACHHVVDPESKLGLCPLSRINESHNERAWAAGWIEGMATLQDVKITADDRAEIQNGINLLAGEHQRTLTNLKPKIASAKIKAVLEGVIMGPLGDMLNAERDGLDDSSVHVFELEELMKLERRYAVPVLQYLIHVMDRRIGSRPTMVVLDEAWTLLEDEFMSQVIRAWLKTLRKKNTSLVAGTQGLDDLANAPLVGNVLIQECVTKVFLPNFAATNKQQQEKYINAGLTEHETVILSKLERKSDYFYVSPNGRRVFGLDLGPVALSIIGASSGDDLKRVRELSKSDPRGWVARWLAERGLVDWADAWRTKIDPDAPLSSMRRFAA